MKHWKKLAMCSFLSLLIPTNVRSQNVLKVHRVSSAVELDGRDNESFWKELTALDMTRQSPDYAQPSSEKSEIKLAYDDKNLYVMAKLYSRDPKNVQNYSLQRDGDCPCDWVGFAIGGDGANPPSGFAFGTTPSGLRWDSFLVDGAGGLSLDPSFNTFWNVASTIDPNVGWTAEFSIPWSSLRFTDKNPEEILMDFVIWRKITYNNEFVVYPNIPPNWGVMSFAKLSKGQKISFEGIKSSRPVYVFPYAVVGNEQTKSVAESTTENDFKREIGVDLKYSITNNLTLDATINTDFAQVEADNVQINLSRASLFFPEKRGFFLERKDKFDFGFSGFNPASANVNNAFYSRRIGLENGRPSRIYGGARLVGRAGKWDVGMLNMLTENSTSELLGNTGESDIQNMGVVRLKRQAFDADTYIGGVYTSIIKGGGRYNHLVGVDALLKIFNDNFLKLAVAQSFDNTVGTGASFNQTRYDVRVEKRNENGWFYALSHGLVGNRYVPGLGFEERGDRWNNSYKVGYGIFSKKSEKIFRHVLLSNGWLVNNYSHGNLESVYVDGGYVMERKNGSGITVKPIFQKENLQAPLQFSNTVSVPVGNYEFSSGQLGLTSPSVYSFNTNVGVTYGDFYDGTKFTFNGFVRWDANRFFKLTANYQNDKVNFKSRQQSLTNQLMGLNALVMFNTKLSLSGLIQYNTLNNRFGSNIRFRYNPRERRDFFIVFNNGVNIRQNEALSGPEFWNIQVKYTRALILHR